MSKTQLLYHYDPLDRLIGCSAPGVPQALRFYQQERQVTEVEGPLRRSIFQQADTLLAEQRHNGTTAQTMLLATDQQRSVLQAGVQPLVYSPYGFCAAGNGLLSLLGFNGERPDPVTGHYLLGNGYRAFNPLLMRFNSPDSWSPFGKGGLNSYAYCQGQPMLRTDATGHFAMLGIVASMVSKWTRNAEVKGLSVHANHKVYDDVFTFRQHTPSGTNLLVKGHGRLGANGSAMLDGGSSGLIDAPRLVEEIEKSDFLGTYKSAKLLMCFGADGGVESFAQKFANESGLVTKAYSGLVFVNILKAAKDLPIGKLVKDKYSLEIAKGSGWYKWRYYDVKYKSEKFYPETIRGTE